MVIRFRILNIRMDLLLGRHGNKSAIQSLWRIQPEASEDWDFRTAKDRICDTRGDLINPMA